MYNKQYDIEFPFKKNSTPQITSTLEFEIANSMVGQQIICMK
ncbi:hypothetical protein P872_08815 [Rhodonellum psychrophilum GCM71 = DSM 17998]|uniref:Uncharacterized protein n=1 Tax=Rhodonellum psychrophilum GCM71 = DSM 17998 TaxID=1123057 RepID=U5C0Z7_9BACT|nr:hypothetical protein P872_08815 [Rhodonellum psychrophilum GCM71 = DSM 17998]